MTADQPGGKPRGIAGYQVGTRYGDPGLAGFITRSFARSMGFSGEALGKPVVGIVQTWSELNNCHAHFKELAEAVKRGVWQAGGLPLEFPTISVGESFLQPTSMFFRNLMAMDVEEMLRGQPLDAVVLLAGCDKTTPAMLMGAASADVPAIMLTGGPTLSGHYRGRSLGACSDCRAFWTEYRAGRLTADELAEVEDSLCRSAGHCTVMGTASTMAAICEALGMALPGCAAIPAPDSRRYRLAEATGKQAVALIDSGLRPSEIMTLPAFENAIRTLAALGGSTNAVVHLIAIAGRLGVPLPLARFDEISRETPLLANVKPSGKWHMEQVFEAGGIPALMRELEPWLALDQITVTGQTLGANIAGAVCHNRDVIASRDQPLAPEGGLSVLYGNLAPNGAVLKHSAASPNLLRHRGRAVVFTSLDDLQQRIDDPDLDVTRESILVLQNAGPIGAPGMPEAGMLPIPKKLLAQGVRDIVRLSDARMSGTAYGTVVLHIAPEAAVGGPLGLARSGDWIELNVDERRLTLDVPEAELAARRAAWRAPERHFDRGYGKLFVDHVLQADQGMDFDFLLAKT